MSSTRWALWRALAQRQPTHVASGGHTKWNHTRDQPPATHTLDALAVGRVEAAAQGSVQAMGHRHARLLQRADGCAHTIRKEQGVSSRP